jgi:hypothetical protein
MPVRRIFAVPLVLLAVLGIAVQTAAASTDHERFTVDVPYDGPVSYCGFPLVSEGNARHTSVFRFADLPDDLPPLSDEAVFYQVEGKHFTDFAEVVTNPANGRTLEYTGTSLLIRTDFDTSNLTLGPNGKLNGYLIATDHTTASQRAHAPNGLAYQIAGTERSVHVSFIVDGVRVGRLDIPYFTHGHLTDELCSYLAG